MYFEEVFIPKPVAANANDKIADLERRQKAARGFNDQKKVISLTNSKEKVSGPFSSPAFDLHF